jgi:hypothetical protein
MICWEHLSVANYLWGRFAEVQAPAPSPTCHRCWALTQSPKTFLLRRILHIGSLASSCESSAHQHTICKPLFNLIALQDAQNLMSFKQASSSGNLGHDLYSSGFLRCWRPPRRAVRLGSSSSSAFVLPSSIATIPERGKLNTKEIFVTLLDSPLL